MPGSGSSADTSSSSDNDHSSDTDQYGNESRQLSPEQVDVLVQFQDITGIDDIQICRALLESNGWDLESTAREQLNLPQSSQDRDPPVRHRPIGLHSHAPEMISDLPPPESPRNQVVAQEGFLSWALNLIILPVRLPMVAFRAISCVFQYFASMFGFGGPARRSLRLFPPLGPYNPEADVENFITSFAHEFGGAGPNFFRGTYARSLEVAKRDLQFLLVYLHYPGDSGVSRFCSSTLCSEDLLKFIRDNDFITWGCSVETGEGYKVSQVFKERKYPFLAVVVLRNNRMTIVGRFEEAISSVRLVSCLTSVLRANEAYIVAARADRQERLINQQIRLEQDAALQESLRQDQEKERKKQQEAEAKRLIEEQERREREAVEQRKEMIRRLKIDFATRVPDEPRPDDPDVVRLLIKFPGGQRLERRFQRQDSIKSLFFFVFCHPDSPDEFDITTNFPRKVIPCKPDDIANIDQFVAPTFQETGINQSTTLFVNDLDA